MKLQRHWETFANELGIDDLTEDFCTSFDGDSFQIKLKSAINERTLQEKLKALSQTSEESEKDVTLVTLQNNMNEVMALGIQHSGLTLGFEAIREAINELKRHNLSYVYKREEVDADVENVAACIYLSTSSCEECQAMIHQFNEKWNGQLSCELVLSHKS
ncbi:MAG: hypothetical protein GW760_02350 [Legionella sp.]|nr:hypothetical protein [Legionella sp.]